MKKERKRYKVYTQEFFHSDEHSRVEEMQFVGETYAVSEKQAINNVRHRMLGDCCSQHKPIGCGNEWTNGYLWKAYKV